ncbi:MAG TPA: UV DNA damage repair endonuclease UvsE [Gemmatimonadales bacterium]|nr:UV DNA damage repair endonuclease UvsE [Gemmatimonadales bacterium]
MTLRFGLCCQFLDSPIRFRTATHRYVSTLSRAARRAYLATIASENAAALAAAVERCTELGIGAFRINSQLLPLGTHPVSGYALEALDRTGAISAAFAHARELAHARDIRLSFHPDQFVVLNSQREDVVRSSIEELEYQAGMAEMVGADTVVFHGGSVAGGLAAATERLERGLASLSDRARRVVALENDDHRFAPADLLPLARRAGIPLVYDVHHHRCHGDGMSVEEATEQAAGTWNGREPWTHISSPRDGWDAGNSRPHADYIDPRDFPEAWRRRRMTVDVEAKAKERAVVALMAALRERKGTVRRPQSRPGGSTVTEPAIPTPPGPPCVAQ